MLKIIESNVTVLVKNMNKAVSFYENLGLKIRNRWGDHYAQLETANIIIGLHPTENDLPSNEKISIGFMLDDIGEGKSLLEKLQIDYHYADGKSGQYAHFKDPDGNFLYFTQPTWR